MASAQGSSRARPPGAAAIGRLWAPAAAGRGERRLLGPAADFLLWFLCGSLNVQEASLSESCGAYWPLYQPPPPRLSEGWYMAEQRRQEEKEAQGSSELAQHWECPPRPPNTHTHRVLFFFPVFEPELAALSLLRPHVWVPGHVHVRP